MYIFAIMKKEMIRMLIVAMTIVLVGLTSIQFYWISNAIALREQKFGDKVYEAVNKAISTAEKQQLADRFRDNSRDFLRGLFDYNIDTLSRIITFELDTGEAEMNRDLPIELHREVTPFREDTGLIFFEQGGGYREYVSYDTTENKREYKLYIDKDDQKIKANIVQQKFDSPADLKKGISEYMRKSGVISDVFNSLFEYEDERKAEDRIDLPLLDSLLTKELTERGVHASFNFGVWCSKEKRLVTMSSPDDSLRIAQSNYRFALFPESIFTMPDELLIYFPSKRFYVVKTMWTTLLSSAIMILITILIFHYTIVNLVKQKKLSDMKNDFINNMTHELKTPISTISLACEALSDKDIPKTENTYTNYIRIIDEENKRLAVLTENVLQTALIDRGHLHLKKEIIDINELVSSIVNSSELILEKRGGYISVTNKATKTQVHADPFHIGNAIQNLLDNAGKYCQNKPVISLVIEENGNSLIISVQDNGIGIPKNDQKKIFDKFYRVPTGNLHNVKGYGLGLSYVKAIVEMHHGSIGVESEPGKGSRFFFHLPYERTNN